MGTEEYNVIRQEKVEAALAKIEEGVAQVFYSDTFQEDFKNYLNYNAQFHTYSANNIMLIKMQNGQASRVAGFNKWKELGRSVKKGEKGINILAPCSGIYKYEKNKLDENGNTVLNSDGKPEKVEEERTYRYFKVVSVFDISQTEGKEPPSLVKELVTDDASAKELFGAIRGCCLCPITITREDDDRTLRSGAKGYYQPDENKIVIKDGMSDMQTLKTAIHEWAHSDLHKETGLNRQDCEIQAEAVAYSICHYFNMDTSEYSFPYIAVWSKGKEPDELRAVLKDIQESTKRLITAVEPEFQERMKRLEREVIPEKSTPFRELRRMER